MVFLSEVVTWTLATFTPFLCRTQPGMIHSGPESSAVRQAETSLSLCIPCKGPSLPQNLPSHCVQSPHTFFQLPLNLVSSNLNVSVLGYHTGINQTCLSPQGCEQGGELCARRIKLLSNGKLIWRWAVIPPGFSCTSLQWYFSYHLHSSHLEWYF